MPHRLTVAQSASPGPRLIGGHHEEHAYRDLVWTEKALYAIEEYIFSRFYMYENVYMHKTTRGYEKLLHKMWQRAKDLKDAGTDVDLVKPIAEFWRASEPSVQQFTALEEHVVLSQIQAWTDHKDRALSDLARRFLCRKGFVAIDGPSPKNPIAEENLEWRRALEELVGDHMEYRPADVYVLYDKPKTTVYSAYVPDRAEEELLPRRLSVSSKKKALVEISHCCSGSGQ